MSLSVTQLPVAGFDKNFSYLIADDVTREAFIVDPTGSFVDVMKERAQHEYHINGILLTHTHHDHIEQLAIVVAQYHAPIYVHKIGETALDTYEDVRTINDGDILLLGGGKVKVLHTPGHTDDSVCFYISVEDAADHIPKLISGDTLFVGGCGRTNEQRIKDLYESLAELASLPDSTTIYPGHDYGDTPTSTIGQETTTNRFYQATNFSAFKQIRLG